MKITYKHHSIITLILLGIILIATIFTKVTTVTIIERAGGVASDTNSDLDLAARDQIAVNRNHYDILMEERALFGVPSTSQELATQATNQKKICEINQELKTLCQTNCINVGEDTKRSRGCYKHCLDESGNDISSDYECVDINMINGNSSIDYSDILEEKEDLEEQLRNLQNDLSNCELEKSAYERIFNDPSYNIMEQVGDIFPLTN